jgi:hypothetical protein
MFCSWLYCWLGMTRYTRSTPLLPLWCRCDLYSPFLSWVLCHRHGHSAFNLHQKEQRAVIHFCGLKVYQVLKCIEGCQCSMWTVSYYNGLPVNGSRGSKMVAQALIMGKEPDANPHPLLILQNTVETIKKLNFEVLEHPLYSLHLTTSDSPVWST